MYKMSFVGSCIAQAAALDSQDGRLASVEAAVATKVEQATYLAKVAALDAKDSEQEGRLSAVETGKVAVGTYMSKMSALDAKDAEQDGHLSALDSVVATKVSQAAYDSKVAALEAKDAEQDGRLTAVEGSVSAIQTDISGRVQSAIDEKVAQVVFDSLATELRDADSALTTALATKVAATTQASVDAAQDAIIAQKATIAGVNSALNNLVNAFNGEIERLDAVDASKLNTSAFDSKVAALEEFINLFLRTYTITLPNNTAYAYSGSYQNVLLGGFQAENPVNLAYDSVSKLLTFNLPNTAAQLTFVDVNINGQWVQRWNPSLNQPNTTPFSRTGSAITIDLSAFNPSGTLQIFTRYDAHTGNSDAGYAQLTV